MALVILKLHFESPARRTMSATLIEDSSDMRRERNEVYKMLHENRLAFLAVSLSEHATRSRQFYFVPFQLSELISDFLMAVGRPVLILHAGNAIDNIGKVIIGWKDTKESQRAVASALPLLKRASEITVVSIVPEDDLSYAYKASNDVAAWLKQHGIPATIQPMVATGDDASQLEEVAKEKDAGLIIAGAYGHSRLKEWILGGVTRDLVQHSQRCAFLSH